MDFAAPPPAIYDHEPTKPYRVARLPAKEVEKACGGIKTACAIPRKRVIAIDKSIAGELLARILRHEKGHMNGWQH